MLRADGSYDVDLGNGFRLMGGSWRVDTNAHLLTQAPAASVEGGMGQIPDLNPSAVALVQGSGKFVVFRRLSAEQSKVVFSIRGETGHLETAETPDPKSSWP